jgi:hypothetical protein
MLVQTTTHLLLLAGSRPPAAMHLAPGPFFQLFSGLIFRLLLHNKVQASVLFFALFSITSTLTVDNFPIANLRRKARGQYQSPLVRSLPLHLFKQLFLASAFPYISAALHQIEMVRPLSHSSCRIDHAPTVWPMQQQP